MVLDYTENSSSSGRENFLNGLTDFGVSALPATAEELAAHPEYRDFTYVPLMASAVVIAYNFVDPYTGTQLDNVVLSPRLVARIITNSSLETFFLDRELLRLNPGVRFPTGTLARPLLRAERNADTRILTSWFSSDAGAKLFLAGADTYRIPVNLAYAGYPYPQDLFETVSLDSEYFPRQGQRANALRLFYGVTSRGIFKENTSLTGLVSILDLPTARRFGLKVAKLAQSDGTSLAPSDEAILAGIDDMDSSAEGVLVSDPTPEDLTAYPLVKIDYALVPKTIGEQIKLEKIKRVLKFALNDGQTGLPSGYVALPEAIRLEGISALKEVSGTTTTVTPTTVKPYRPPTNTVASDTSMTSTTAIPTTTSTTTTSTTTTSTLSPITVPVAVGGLPSSGTSKSGILFAGLIGLSGATLLGTIRPRQKARRR
ncbi:hypothetical protein LBMAG12_00120 [Actinomycetes bacterium]|nr:hypothetical protein LBMAG12_00120 [Actinomycetes bacterium]